jgi:hypothetical protein
MAGTPKSAANADVAKARTANAVNVIFLSILAPSSGTGPDNRRYLEGASLI